MTPKEKAIDLTTDFYDIKSNEPDYGMEWEMAKKCALIAVEEIIESEKLDYLFSKEEINSMEFTSDSMWIYERFSLYWKEVKKELRKL